MCDHIRSKHTRQAEYSAKICSKKFYTSKSLAYHSKRHSCPSMFYCIECQRFFSVKDRLKHENMHPKKNFPCNTCGKLFLTRDRLYTHKAVHTEHKFPCTKCNRKFHQANNLKVHMARKHGITKNAIFKCVQCSRSYNKACHLRSHQSNDHNSAKPLEKVSKRTEIAEKW